MTREPLQIKTIHYVRQFTDGSGCFLLLMGSLRGVVPFYSSAEAYTFTGGRGEGNYSDLLRRSVPATPAQIVDELDSYADALEPVKDYK